MRACCSLAILAAWSCLHARPAAAADPPKLAPEIQSLIDFSHAAPPEFAADALLRIVESGRIESPDVRRDLVEQAFQLAAHAGEPMRRVPLPGSQADTRAGYRGAALKLGLDALSLECRAIRQMLRLDKARARELFTSLTKPALDPLGCESALLYDLDDFYSTLGQIVASTFKPDEIRRGEPAQFLAMYIGRITAHAELAPAARVIGSAELPPAGLEVAAGTFLSRLGSMPSDDRSFSVAVTALQTAIEALSESMLRQGVANAGLIRAFHDYLISNLSGPRCEDNAGSRSPGRTPATAAVVEWYNYRFHGDAPLIRREETRPSRVDGSAKIERYWTSAAAKQIMADARNLRFNAQDRPLSDAERDTLEWSNSLTEVLTEVDNWKAGDEASEADYFHQKSIVYEAMLELAPAGGLRDRILGAYVAFLANSSLQQDSPVEWFWHAQSTLSRLRNASGGGAERLLAEFRRSGNPVLALYANLETTLPSSPFWQVR